MTGDIAKKRLNVLDKLLSLNVGHTVHTGDTITKNTKSASHFRFVTHVAVSNIVP